MVASLKIKGKLNKKIIKGYAIPTVLIIFEIYFLIILSAATPKKKQSNEKEVYETRAAHHRAATSASPARRQRKKSTFSQRPLRLRRQRRGLRRRREITPQTTTIPRTARSRAGDDTRGVFVQPILSVRRSAQQKQPTSNGECRRNRNVGGRWSPIRMFVSRNIRFIAP